MAPFRVVTFISKLSPEPISDKEIVCRSGLLNETLRKLIALYGRSRCFSLPLNN